MNGLELTLQLADLDPERLVTAFFPEDDNQLANISKVTSDGSKIFLITTWEGPPLSVAALLNIIQDIRLKVFHTELPVVAVMPWEDPVPSAEITSLAHNGPNCIQLHAGTMP